MSQFDYIVVGAGSGGSVMADKLSEDPRNQVLLIEEGTVGDDFLSLMPKGFGKILSDPARAHFIPTVHSRGTNEPEIWVRGKQLGGSSAVNGMVWTRGQPADWDKLAELAGPQWAWPEMLRIYKSMENHAMGESETRGVGGPVDVKTHPAPTAITDAFVEAGVEMGLPRKLDQNQLEQEGIGYLQWNIDPRGRRVSAGRAFLGRARGRPNLTIATGVRTDRIVIENGRAVAVEGVRDGQPARYDARGEIVLAAGAIGSAKLLQLSGVGPADVLSAAGITVKVDSPDVGRHLREHWLVQQNWRMRSWDGCQNRSYSGLNLLGNVARFVLFGAGPLSYGSSEAVAWARVLPESARPDVQIMFQPYSLKPGAGMAFEDEPGFSTYTMVTKPQSEGTMKITSPDPASPMEIDPNYLSAEHDRRVQLGAIRFVREMMRTPAMARMCAGETADTIGFQTDAEILDLFRRRGQSGYHLVSTARMGKDQGPVDGRLRVRGVEGLRIADCSVFPEMIAGNTNAPTMAMAWRGAELILEDRKA